MSQHLQALVFGASGISGWGIVREALSYPTVTTFDRVIGLTNRPLSKEAAYLPSDDRLELVSGVDLTKGVDSVAEQLEAIKGGVSDITHVYFVAYTSHGSDPQEVLRANVDILETAVQAVEKVAPNVRAWSLQTGGKVYGVEYVQHIPLHAPFKESQPRIPRPFADNIFYYAQYDALEKLSVGKAWTFTEIRPDAIVGFVPNNNAMNIIQGLAIFLSLYASIHGTGAKVAFPGAEAAFTALHNDTSQEILARFSIYASLHTDVTSRKAFNIADGGAVRWADGIWAGVCSYFGLVGVAPDPNNTDPMPMITWVNQHADEWSALEKKHGLKADLLKTTGWEFVQVILGMATFDRHYDLSAARSIGFTETVDTVKAYHVAFDRMREAKMIL